MFVATTDHRSPTYRSLCRPPSRRLMSEQTYQSSIFTYSHIHIFTWPMAYFIFQQELCDHLGWNWNSTFEAPMFYFRYNIGGLILLNSFTAKVLYVPGTRRLLPDFRSLMEFSEALNICTNMFILELGYRPWCTSTSVRIDKWPPMLSFRRRVELLSNFYR